MFCASAGIEALKRDAPEEKPRKESEVLVSMVKLSNVLGGTTTLIDASTAGAEVLTPIGNAAPVMSGDDGVSAIARLIEAPISISTPHTPRARSRFAPPHAMLQAYYKDI